MFCPYTEISYSVVSFAVKKYILRSGIDISRKKHGPHSLRSSLATSMINDGISYSIVALRRYAVLYRILYGKLCM
ncbi:tyrosine-type recombinase/integrase [Lachnospiraceae bacterium KGMB03038]|nr:tyrosine-type recombinase/integrase [Lachnospiraceae bacterium KGMB03038]